MFATVTYPYRDRETYEIHRTGDTVELTPERFAELSANGYVDAASPIEPMEPAAEPAPAAPPEQEMTAQQLRDAIEAKGGFAPKKANKAQLAELLGAL